MTFLYKFTKVRRAMMQSNRPSTSGCLREHIQRELQQIKQAQANKNNLARKNLRPKGNKYGESGRADKERRAGPSEVLHSAQETNFLEGFELTLIADV